MTQPTVGAYAQRLYDTLQVYVPDDEQHGWAFLHFLEAIGQMRQPVDDIVRQAADGRDGLQALMDPDTCPAWALPWLAMFAGVQLSIELDETQQRETIKQCPARDRGKKKAIVGAARRYLTDPAAGTVTITELYHGDPYTVLLVTYAPQTPDPDAVVKAVTADDTAPAGVVFVIRVDPGWSIGAMEAAYEGQTIADLEADFATINDLEVRQP